MTDYNDPRSEHFDERGGSDPLDAIREARPQVAIDPAVIARVGDRLQTQFVASHDEQSQANDRSIGSQRTDGPMRLLPSDETTPVEEVSSNSRLFGRSTFVGLVAAVVLAALFISPLFGANRELVSDEEATVSDPDSVIETAPAHDPSVDDASSDKTIVVEDPSDADGSEPTSDDVEDRDEADSKATTDDVEDPSDADRSESTSDDVENRDDVGSGATSGDVEDRDDGERNTTGDSEKAFIATFDNNAGLDQFRVGVYHRNIGSQELGQDAEVWGDSNAFHGGTWTADHDTECGPPGTQRTLDSRKIVDSEGGVNVDFGVDEVAYLCRDHLMTSMGDVDGYSIVWFSPDAQFSRNESKTVSWEVNVTDLMARQWWEVSIVPVGSEFLATSDSLAGTANIGTYDPDAVVIGNGPFGGDIGMTVNGQNQYNEQRSLCGNQWALDLEGCADKKIRRTFSVTDNDNGTLTIDYGGLHSQVVDGQLPANYEVFFKDHNYTPDKDGQPIGHTWHWDSIRIE